MLASRTSDGAPISDSSDTDVMVGSTSFSSLNYVVSVRAHNAEDEERSLFQSLEHNVTSMPSFASTIHFVLVGPRATTLPFVVGSLKQSVSDDPTSLGILHGRYADGSEDEWSTDELNRVSATKESEVCALRFMRSQQLWTISLIPSLSQSPDVFSMLNSMKAVAVHLFVTPEMDEAQVKSELKWMTKLELGCADSAAKLANAHSNTVAAPAPSTEEAVASLSEFVHSEATAGAAELKAAMDVIRSATLDLPLQWDQEKHLYEEEIRVLEEMRTEAVEKVAVSEIDLEEVKKQLKETQGVVADLTAKMKQQRTQLEQRCEELHAKLQKAESQSSTTTNDAVNLKSRLAVTEERLERFELEIDELRGSADLQLESKQQLWEEHRRLLAKLDAMETAVSGEVQKMEDLDVDHRIQEYEAALKEEKITQLTLVAEFQRKEIKWQALLRDAEEFRRGVMEENARLRERTEQQLKTFSIAKDAIAFRQQQDEMLFHSALTQVKELSPHLQRYSSPEREWAQKVVGDQSGVRSLDI